MNSIDIGDLSIFSNSISLQQALFEEIRLKIINKLWIKGAKLPSTRKMAEELKISRNTVTLTYEQLVAEGYIESKAGSGFFICVDVPDSFLQPRSPSCSPNITHNPKIEAKHDKCGAFSPGVPALDQFPYAKWLPIVQRHFARSSLGGSSDLQGLPALRSSLSRYLSSARSVDCTQQRIIVTSGAQQALTIATLATLSPMQTVLMENPGYSQMLKVLKLFNFDIKLADNYSGSETFLQSISSQHADAIYLTPSNQYPMGTSLNTEQRIHILQWAEQNNSWIIEDDYDSEFQFSSRPYASLQGLAAQSRLTERCIYIGSFSKTMFNSLRIGYMVVPESILEKCLAVKEAIGGTTQSHYQAALAEFIDEGHFLRHLRKMRKLYQQKRTTLIESVERHFVQEDISRNLTVLSQAAGLHVTFRWQSSLSENDFVQQALKEGITIRPLAYYENSKNDRDWQSVVLGYGNTPLENIDMLIKTLSEIFHRCH